MNKKNILLIINDSWGEVDWILPVLYHLKNQFDMKITVFFNSDEIFNEKQEFEDLFYFLNELSNDIITPSSLKMESQSLKQNYHLSTKYEQLENRLNRSIDYIFHDYSGVDYGQFYKIFPEAKIIVFPHGTFIYGWLNNDLKVQISKSLYYNKISKDALLLIGSNNDKTFFKELTNINNICVSGHPKLNNNWIDILQNYNKINNPISSNKKLKFLLIQYPKRRIKKKEIYDELILSILDLAKLYDAEIIVKRHPRQDHDELTTLLNNHKNVKVTLATESVLTTASKSSLAISFPSSACMDAIAAEIPVIEYFNYTEQDWSTFLKASTGSSSIYRKLNLVLSTNNREELNVELDKLINDDKYYKINQSHQNKTLFELDLLNYDSLTIIEKAIENL